MSTKKRIKKNYTIEYLKKIGITAVVLFIVFTFVFGIAVVRGNYMFPALRDGDLVITYKLEPAVATEVIAYKRNGTTKLGRIVASAGETIDINEGGGITVNGSIITEEVFYPTEPVFSSEITFPYTVPENSYFVLNDYRTLEGEDSRVFGAVPKKDCKGKVTFVFRRRGF